MTSWRAIAVLTFLPSLIWAQTAEVPLIQLQPMAPEVVAPADTVNPAPAAPKKAPQIELSAPVTESTVEPQASSPTPMGRDTGALPAEPVADWLLALVPAALDVPREVHIGSSMPEPGQFRLTGEKASADFLLTLPQNKAAPTELLLSLRSSANVLAETSHLAISINGVDVGQIALDNIGDFAEQRVPTSALIAGVNRITLTATQTHRIFCGPEASFAIWTEISLGKSGVTISPAALSLDSQGFLAALESQVAQGGAVEILVDDGTDISLIRQVAGRVTDALGGEPKIVVQPFYSMQTEQEPRARVALINAPEPKASVRRGAGGALVLQVEHAAGVSPDLSALLPVRSAESGVAALEPGRDTTVAELGRATILANTRYFSEDVTFLLPEDWLLLASQKANFTIHYGFSGDLSAGALLLIKVNGQTVRLLPLDRNGGKVQPPLDISFRANRLNPGVNTLTFEMSVPGDPPDLPCTPRSTDMLVILGDSVLNVPPSPKMSQTDMSRSLSRLSGDDISVPPEVADPVKDIGTLVPFGALFRPLLNDGTKAQLHIVRLDAVGLVPTGTTGVTRRMLQNAVYSKLEIPTAGTATTQPETAPPAPSSEFSLADAKGTVAVAEPVDTSQESFWSSVEQFFSPEGWLSQEMGGVRDLSFPGTTTLVSWLKDKSGEALLLQLDPTKPDDIWLIAGPDIEMSDLAKQVDRFRRGGRGEVHGQAALLLKDESWVTWSEKRRPELLEPLTIWNLRAVLGNYASWSPLLFTIATLICALLSIIPALLFVVITRRSGSRV